MNSSALPRIAFRPLTEEDLPQLHAWLQRPHVAQWWHEPGDLDAVREDFGPMLAPDSRERGYIVLLDDAPGGFVQCYHVAGSEEGWWPGQTDPGARGIDLFLADEERQGRGLGGRVIRAFVEREFANPAVTWIQADPSPENARAIGAFRRAGFLAMQVVETPDGPAQLMIRER